MRKLEEDGKAYATHLLRQHNSVTNIRHYAVGERSIPLTTYCIQAFNYVIRFSRQFNFPQCTLRCPN